MAKSTAKELKEKLLMKKKNAILRMDDAAIRDCDKFCEGYKRFLDVAKTEREASAEIVKMAKARGFVEFSAKAHYKPGDKVYKLNREKSVILSVIGKEPIENGVNLVAAHIDSPRLDMKQNPLYEKDEVAYFKTHYYGGIKKYQWPTVPLSLHGVIVKADGSKVTVNIGEDENDPVFCISDLLVHLAQEQMTKNAKEVVEGEALNLIVGGRPLEGEEKDAVKANVLKLLADKYFCNFSLFQSLPDSWAIDQIFPIMPIQRLDEKPDRSATLQDITCDSDGKIANFISTRNVAHYLPVHSLKKTEPYYVAVFLVGAYQEILGDMHNLFGDTNAVHVSVNEKGYNIEQIIDGETVAEVLDYVQYNPKKLVRTLETWVTKSVKEGKISLEEGKEFLSNYRSGLYGYTYLE